MKGSLRVLLTGAIDYAGLFPPAKLPLEDAVSNYARYRTEPESWMLGRFICPAGRLAELPPLVKRFFSDAGDMNVSVLGRGGKDTQDFLAGLRADLREIATIPSHWAQSFEARLPESLTDVAALTELMIATADLVRRSAPSMWTSYFEIPFDENWSESIRTAAQAARRALEHQLRKDIRFFYGLKLRCGGQEPAAFPTPQQLAFAFRTTHDLGGVLLKFTAGLHHPFRHFNDDVQTHMHGFLNVLVAAVLSAFRGIGEEQIQEILRDERPEDFVFADEEFRWREISASASEIAAARALGVGSFGSCSFDEPRDDLRALGLL